ncbi:MAG: TA0956 family protein [Ferroplasma sp.]|uniref:TA0956 family protein n=1 Tax=Ferroplasma sp. TaxID=2591003 RepID=UPI002816777C|nr:TA0956 family protein [Ferroplasma sp.]WMT50698.1 MAG: TA0956 family protein [Ferroplasma sp.]
MANCVAYNIRHSLRSTTMCVPLGKLNESLDDLNNYLDNINKFIDKYGQSEGVGKDDANAGIIIVNTGKKIVDISFSQNLGIDKQKVNRIVEELKNKKYNVKAQFPSTPF